MVTSMYLIHIMYKIYIYMFNYLLLTMLCFSSSSSKKKKIYEMQKQIEKDDIL